MSQRKFKDPIVSSGPTLVGVGNGTLNVQRLTHFTTAQTYTLTCIAKSPDTIFSVVGSLDGPVGLATVGSQFFDADLKIFLTITQGSTPFEVGDAFTVGVVNGTDLNQDNIDDYDEEPQKNFGIGNKGAMSGDHNVRFTDANQPAHATVQGVKLETVLAGASLLTFQLLDTLPATFATLVANGFTFTAVASGTAGNAVQVEFVNDVIPGNESVGVSGNLITIHINAGTTTRTIVNTQLGLQPLVAGLVTYSFTSGSTLVTAQAATNLANGVNTIGAEGFESATVVGNDIKVYIASGRSTLSSIVSAITASGPASALVNVDLTGNGSDVAYLMASSVPFIGGDDREFALNKKEITDAGNFFEGNADLRAKDAAIQGSAKVSGNAEIAGSLALTNGNTNAIADVQDYINRLIQDGKVTLRTSDHTKVSWLKPNLSFTADIHIEFADTGITNKIALANSPLSVADGFSAYVILDRQSTRYVAVTVAATVPKNINAFRLLTRYGDNILLWDNTLVRDGKSVRIGEGGEGSGLKVDLYDPISTTLPTGPTATIDGVAVVNDYLVLFSNLGSGNKRVYKAAGVGTSITWTAQSVYSNGLDPLIGDDVMVIRGAGFQQARGFYDGTSFLFNDRVRYYNGADYWEVSNLKQVTLANNATGNVFAINYAGSENLFVDYSVVRNGKKRAGTITLTTDGTTVAFSDTGAEMVPELGIIFDADISGATIRLRYTTTNSGFPCTMKFVTRRWSDSAGGPGGLPSYSGSSGTPAAGADTQIQFNDGGATGADADFTWSKTNKVLGLADLEVMGLQGPVTLADNTVSPATAFSYDGNTYPSAVIEYSIFRDGDRRTGRLLISSNGVDVGYDDAFTETNPTGVTISVVMSGSTVLVQFSSTSTGMDASLKYNVRRWS